MPVNKWMPHQTSRGPVEIKVEYPNDGALPIKLYIRRDKSKFVSFPGPELIRKYNNVNEAIEAESRILFA